MTLTAAQRKREQEIYAEVLVGQEFQYKGQTYQIGTQSCRVFNFWRELFIKGEIDVSLDAKMTVRRVGTDFYGEFTFKQIREILE